MNIQSKASFAKASFANTLFSRPRAALALAASMLGLGAPAAQAQWFNSDSALPPARVERMVQASGYRLTGPIIRNGRVYLANVLGREDDPERLVIEANSGRLLQRYQAPARQERFVANDYWSGLPRLRPFAGWFDGEDDVGPPRQQPMQSSQGGWGGRDEEAAPPRPPARIGAASPDAYRAQPSAPVRPERAPTANNVARADDGSAPYVIMAPDHAPAAQEAPLEKPRLKPQVRRKKPEQTPLAQPAAAPSNAQPTPLAQPAVVPNGAQPTPVAQPATVPNAAKPSPMAQPARPPSAAAPPRSEAAKEPEAAAPRVADTKAAAPPPAPQTAAVAPAPKAPARKPVVNDVPVDPLE